MFLTLLLSIRHKCTSATKKQNNPSFIMFRAINVRLQPSKVSSLVAKRRGSSIPVILLNELPNKGNIGEVLPVKRGYARNYLIPKKIAGTYGFVLNILRLFHLVCSLCHKR